MNDVDKLSINIAPQHGDDEEDYVWRQIERQPFVVLLRSATAQEDIPRDSQESIFNDMNRCTDDWSVN